MITGQKNRNGLLLFLILILTIRITSYFMLSESLAITQGIKITMRLLTVGLSAFLLAVCYRKNNSGLAVYENKMPLLFYLLYLFLGTCSLFWTSSFNDSALQLLMDFECLAFSFLFINVLFLLNAPPYKEIRLSKILSVSIFLIAASFIVGLNVLPEIFYRQTHGGEVSRLGGFIINPNELGMLLVIGIAMLFVEMNYAGKKWLPLLFATVPLYALWMTGSRSSMIGLLFILAYFVWKNKNVKLRIAVAAIVVLIIPVVFEKIFIKAGDMSEVLSLTGRIPFWKN